MKRSEKQSPNKGNSREIREIIGVIVGQNCVKGLRFTKIAKEMKLEVVSAE